MTTLTLGLHKDVPFRQYQQWPAVSKHDLDLVARSPAHYQAAKQHPPETTAAMHFGTAAHAWILEPHKAPAEVAVRPRYDRRTKAGKEAYAEFEAMSIGKTIIGEDESRRLAAMAAAVSKNKIARSLIDQAKHIEASVFVHNEQFGVATRCRPDIIHDNVVVDLKTAADASPKAFASSMVKFRYHVQAAYYLDLCRKAGEVTDDAQFVFLVVEKLPPYGVALYSVKPEDIDRGRLQYERDLQRYAHCLKSGQWFGYSEAIGYLDLPIWARNDIDNTYGND